MNTMHSPPALGHGRRDSFLSYSKTFAQHGYCVGRVPRIYPLHLLQLQITMNLSGLALTSLVHPGIWHAITFTRHQHGILAESLPYSQTRPSALFYWVNNANGKTLPCKCGPCSVQLSSLRCTKTGMESEMAVEWPSIFSMRSRQLSLDVPSCQ